MYQSMYQYRSEFNKIQSELDAAVAANALSTEALEDFHRRVRELNALSPLQVEDLSTIEDGYLAYLLPMWDKPIWEYPKYIQAAYSEAARRGQKRCFPERETTITVPGHMCGRTARWSINDTPNRITLRPNGDTAETRTYPQAVGTRYDWHLVAEDWSQAARDQEQVNYAKFVASLPPGSATWDEWGQDYDGMPQVRRMPYRGFKPQKPFELKIEFKEITLKVMRVATCAGYTSHTERSVFALPSGEEFAAVVWPGLPQFAHHVGLFQTKADSGCYRLDPQDGDIVTGVVIAGVPLWGQYGATC